MSSAKMLGKVNISSRYQKNFRLLISISPPPVGDEGIYTKVLNPEAGHEKLAMRRK
jgi:hypothetical protein